MAGVFGDRLARGVLALLLASVLALLLFPVAFAQDVRDEEVEDYYRKWLDEDVVYIITPEERAVFQKLSTPEERERFIEQFWLRRDPDPMTSVNEFKEEHFRRIAFANERYFTGKAGWKSDRGRIYIIHGPPNEIESHPTGGSYRRPMNEGGGTTVAYPFEVWRYRNIEGIGDDVILEFVDQSMTGEFRLTHMPEDKDALLYVPGQGPTIAEMEGRATRAQRPIFAPGGRYLYPMMDHGYRDDPFYRYERYSRVQTPTEIKYKDLQEMVSVNIEYVNLPLLVRQDVYRISESQILVPVTLELQHKDLTFTLEKGEQTARIAIYGIVTSMTGQVAEEFEDDLVTAFKPGSLAEGSLGSSVYQKVLILDGKGRHKIDVIAKDTNSGHIGQVRQAIVAPPFDEQKLSASSLVLANYLQVLEELPDMNEMFVIGDVKVRPSLTRQFSTGMPFGVYLQLYNVGVDQTTQEPGLSIAYRLYEKGKQLLEINDEDGETIQYFSPRLVVLVRQFNLAALPPGDYSMEVEVRDRILDHRVAVKEAFRLVQPQQVALQQ